MHFFTRAFATSRPVRWFGFLLAVVTLGLGAGCHGAPASFLVDLADARQLAGSLRVEFNRATDASNRAVMAETDEASLAFAREAEQATKAVETDLAALTALLRRLGYPKELAALEQFRKQLAEYRKLDSNILALAVENTNLKAQRLSFGAGREAADSMRASLQTLVAAAAAKDRCPVEGLVNKAVLAVREIQVLQAPHIAEADDAAMTRLETAMSGLATTARSALGELSGLVEPNARSSVAAAVTSLDRFDGITAQIVALSRRNTNVRSLDLALRARPPLTAACDASLRTLQDILAHEGSTATR